VLTSSDHLVATNGYKDDGLEGAAGFRSAFNIGYIFIRARAVEFVQAWRDACHKSPNAWDQVLFSSVLNRGADYRGSLSTKRLKRMFKTNDGKHLLAGVLPVSLFASGHTFFVTRMAHLMRRTPYMVHTTFQYGGAEGKRHRLREGMMWEDDPEYYSGPNFLRYTADIPYSLVYPKGKPDKYGNVPFGDRMSVEQHFKLVNHQLVQIRNALALAQALGRILILPRLVCGLDRWWAPHMGIIPGSATKLPLLECPADHVIDLERMKPELILREHNMLCNPRTPKSVLESTAKVSLSGEIRPQRLMRMYEKVKVLEVTGPLPDYHSVLSTRAAADFEKQVRRYGSLWCCNRPPGGRGAGHIWYDPFWDVVPHTDRHNRLWKEAWYPKMGP